MCYVYYFTSLLMDVQGPVRGKSCPPPPSGSRSVIVWHALMRDVVPAPIGSARAPDGGGRKRRLQTSKEEIRWVEEDAIGCSLQPTDAVGGMCAATCAQGLSGFPSTSRYSAAPRSSSISCCTIFSLSPTPTRMKLSGFRYFSAMLSTDCASTLRSVAGNRV